MLSRVHLPPSYLVPSHHHRGSLGSAQQNLTSSKPALPSILSHRSSRVHHAHGTRKASILLSTGAAPLTPPPQLPLPHPSLITPSPAQAAHSLANTNRQLQNDARSHAARRPLHWLPSPSGPPGCCASSRAPPRPGPGTSLAPWWTRGRQPGLPVARGLGGVCSEGEEGGECDATWEVHARSLAQLTGPQPCIRGSACARMLRGPTGRNCGGVVVVHAPSQEARLHR